MKPKKKPIKKKKATTKLSKKRMWEKPRAPSEMSFQEIEEFWRGNFYE